LYLLASFAIPKVCVSNANGSNATLPSSRERDNSYTPSETPHEPGSIIDSVAKVTREQRESIDPKIEKANAAKTAHGKRQLS
jgi:hypothetical protein